jgi:hypothetical protein
MKSDMDLKQQVEDELGWGSGGRRRGYQCRSA